MISPKHRIAALALLAMPSLLWSQTITSMSAPKKEREVRVFVLRYQQPEKMASIIATLMPADKTTISVEAVSQNLIVATLPDQLEQIAKLITVLDVPPTTASRIPPMMYRIYMLEVPYEHVGLKPFSLVLERPSQMSAANLLDAVKMADIELGVFSQVSTRQGWELELEGHAPSNEALQQMLEDISPAGESQIMRLQWEDEISPLPAAHVQQLPEKLRTYIFQLLSPEVETAGYWFGNLSIPAQVQAPIGPWVFELSVKDLTQDNEVELEIVVVEASQANGADALPLLNNTIRSRINKPIIIGYNRERYGTRTMGAMVIIPQEDAPF